MEFGAKTGATISNKYQIQLKKVFAAWNIQNSHPRCSVQESLQEPAQLFSWEYWKIFKSTYFEKHLWMAASENHHLIDKFTERR